jgi:hypothetical protein
MAQPAASPTTPASPPIPATSDNPRPPQTPLFSPVPWALGSLAVALLVAMGEIARLVAMIPDDAGETLPLTGPLSGPATLLTWSLAPWELLHRVGAQPAAPGYITVHVLLDVALIVLYAVVLPRLGDRSTLWKSVLDASAPTWARWASMPRLLYAAAAFDLVEDLGILVVGHGSSAPPLLLWTFSLASKLKWLAVVSFVAWAVVSVRRSTEARAALRAWIGALYRQRFSLLAIMPIAILSLMPAGEVLDQLPDVQRRWFTAPAGQGVPQGDRMHLGIAFALVLFVSGVLFWLGRMVGEYTARAMWTSVRRTERTERWWPWLFGPLVAVIGAIPYWRQVRFGALAVFVGVPLAVIVVSWWATHKKLPTSPNRPGEVTDETYAATVIAGDVIAVGVLAVGCLALVRSAVAVVLVSATSTVSFVAVGAWIAVVAGVVGSTGLWFVGRCLLDRLAQRARSTLPSKDRDRARPEVESTADRTATAPSWVKSTADRAATVAIRVKTTVDRTATVVARDLTPGLRANTEEKPQVSTSAPPGELGQTAQTAAWIFVVAGTIGLLSFAINPAVPQALGVVGTALGCLLSVSALIGATVTLHHQWGAPTAFRIGPLKAREAPIATLLLLALGFAATFGGADIHLARGIERDKPAGHASRPDLETSFAAWLARTEACTVTLSLEARPATPTSPASAAQVQVVRPLFLLAAEGGGVRAAYWTASVIDRLEMVPTSGPPERSRCGAGQVFLATGVSGGSVGLTVARFRTADVTVASHIHNLGKPDALSVGSAGLFARDPLTTLTGIPWGSRDRAWLDRAGLMETSWEQSDGDLSARFLEPPTPRDSTRFAAELVLASATVSTGCRVLVSQIELRPGPDPATPSSCADARAPQPMTIDLLDAYGPGRPITPTGSTADGGTGSTTGEQRCLTSLAASTAAMFSARFPYVTPSGVVGPCTADSDPKSTDGTPRPSRPAEQLVDGGYVDSTGLGVLIDLAPELMALIRKHNATAAIPVVPFALFADNGTGSDLGTARPASIPEVAVPPVGYLTAPGSQNSTHALLQRLEAAIDPADVGLKSTASATAWRSAAPPVSVVYQPTHPAIAAPLGWVLSPASAATMDDALVSSAACPPATDTQSALAIGGYGSLHSALKILGEDTCPRT